MVGNGSFSFLEQISAGTVILAEGNADVVMVHEDVSIIISDAYKYKPIILP
jgi:hypothetical protein